MCTGVPSLTSSTCRRSPPKSAESFVLLEFVTDQSIPRLVSAPERLVRLFINTRTLYGILPACRRAVRLWRRLGSAARIRRGARGSPGAAPAARRITGRSRGSLYDRGCRARCSEASSLRACRSTRIVRVVGDNYRAMPLAQTGRRLIGAVGRPLCRSCEDETARMVRFL